MSQQETPHAKKWQFCRRQPPTLTPHPSRNYNAIKTETKIMQRETQHKPHPPRSKTHSLPSIKPNAPPRSERSTCEESLTRRLSGASSAGEAGCETSPHHGGMEVSGYARHKLLDSADKSRKLTRGEFCGSQSGCA